MSRYFADAHGTEMDDARGENPFEDVEAAEKDLLDLLPDEITNHPDCFHSTFYDRWEREIATPALRALGYEPSGWRTTDGDSFGPLVRAVDLSKDGKTESYFYG